ncbi:hypothetical protein EYC84_001011 [Monilinia fructicola]|uniref:Uncharacterized protein n=1 Tax=Monilinia fructicola TaxID=38448 RepID=A0A5M9JJA6_MONFR|nr:hypothetical protein EYC84_001011 [Monilinia fructicola]
MYIQAGQAMVISFSTDPFLTDFTQDRLDVKISSRPLPPPLPLPLLSSTILSSGRKGTRNSNYLYAFAQRV